MSGVVNLLHLVLMHDHDVSGCPAGIHARYHHRSTVLPLLLMLWSSSYLRVLVVTRDQIRGLARGLVGILHWVTQSAVILLACNVMSLYIVRPRTFSICWIYTHLILDNGRWNTEGALACTPIRCHGNVLQAWGCYRDRVRVATVVRLRNTHVHSTVA